MADLDLAELRRLLAEATPGPWRVAHVPDDRDPAEYLAELLSYGSGRCWGLAVPIDDATDINDEAKFPSITGNGPTSEQNARLIAAAVNALPALLDRLEAAESAEADRFRQAYVIWDLWCRQAHDYVKRHEAGRVGEDLFTVVLRDAETFRARVQKLEQILNDLDWRPDE